MIKHNYISAIGAGFPNVQAYTLGEGDVYENIVLCANSEQALPTKDELDTWIHEETKRQVWEKIKQMRDAYKAGGVRVGTNWFHSDDASRIQFLGLKDVARDILTGGGSEDTVLYADNSEVLWKTMTGEFVPMTVGLVIDIVTQIRTLEAKAFKRAEFHRYAMSLSANPELYDFSTGWPEIYG